MTSTAQSSSTSGVSTFHKIAACLVMAAAILLPIVVLSNGNELVSFLQSSMFHALPDSFMGHASYAQKGLSDTWVMRGLLVLTVISMSVGIAGFMEGGLEKARYPLLIAGAFSLSGLFVVVEAARYKDNGYQPASAEAVLNTVTQCFEQTAGCDPQSKAISKGLREIATDIGASLAAKGCYVPPTVEGPVLCPGNTQPSVSLATFMVQDSEYLSRVYGKCTDVWHGAGANFLYGVAGTEPPVFVKMPRLQQFSCTTTDSADLRNYDTARGLRLVASLKE